MFCRTKLPPSHYTLKAITQCCPHPYNTMLPPYTLHTTLPPSHYTLHCPLHTTHYTAPFTLHTSLASYTSCPLHTTLHTTLSCDHRTANRCLNVVWNSLCALERDIFKYLFAVSKQISVWNSLCALERDICTQRVPHRYLFADTTFGVELAVCIRKRERLSPHTSAYVRIRRLFRMHTARRIRKGAALCGNIALNYYEVST
jgi:hypothetical protein